MKTFLSFLSILVLALGLAGCGDDTDAGIKAAADSFLRNVIAGAYPMAYQEGSMNFRTQTRFDNFAFEAGKVRPNTNAAVSWSEPELQDGSAILSGTVPRATGDPAKVELTLAREIDQWKVTKFRVD